MLVFLGLRKLACALKAGALLPHSKVIKEKASKSVKDKFSDLIVLDPTPLPGLRPEERVPSRQLFRCSRKLKFACGLGSMQTLYAG